MIRNAPVPSIDAAMSRYDLYLMLHISGAMVWVGTAFAMVLLATRAMVARNAERMTGFIRDGEWLGSRVFLPANLIVLVSAVLLVYEGHWGYGQLWIRLGIVGFAASFLAGATFFGPGWSRIQGRADREGMAAASVESALRRLLVGSWFDVGWLIAIVFVMTVKPQPHEWSALAVAAALPIAFGLVGIALLRAQARGAHGRAVEQSSP